MAVPEAEPVVEQHRRMLDPAAGWGVPAHVTVLYPFVHPSAVNEDVIARLHAVIRSTSAFSCQFARTRWFGDEVLWLEPLPADPFRTMTLAVWEAFPHYPPFGGAYDEVVPHLTVAQRSSSGKPPMQAAEGDVQSRLPVSAFIDRVLLVAGTQAADSWRTLSEIPLTS